MLVAVEEALSPLPITVMPPMFNLSAKVEEAEAERPVNVEKPELMMPPANVEVAVELAESWPWTKVVPVATKEATLRLPEMRPLPWMENRLAGEVVPMPTKVVEAMLKREFFLKSMTSK